MHVSGIAYCQELSGTQLHVTVLIADTAPVCQSSTCTKALDADEMDVDMRACHHIHCQSK